jgi:putative two-component system response regulator
MHDVGKRFVNPRILDKPGPLNIEEHSEMEQHVWHGFPSLTHRAEPLPAVCTQVALLHHERLDGSGYPFQLRGSAVPFAARVVAVADVFDALASERPYKQAWPMSAAVGYLAERSGTEFDRRCVSALHSVLGLQRVAAAVPVRSIAVGPAAATTFGFAGA